MIKTKYGHCEYAFEEDQMGSYVHIYNLFVFTEHRRQGKARELLQIAIATIRKIGYNGGIQIVADPADNSISKENLFLFYKSMNLEVFDYYSEN